MKAAGKPPPDGKKVVVMSLYGSSPRYCAGAIRNAQMISVNMPEWRLRVYIERPKPDGSTKYPAVPENVVRKLKFLGAELELVDTDKIGIKPMMWRFLAADDTSIDYFSVRDSDSRLTWRDAIATYEWVKTGKPFHCIRDHPSHGGFSISGGLWGGKPRELSKILQTNFQTIMRGYGAAYLQDMQFLGQKVWPAVSANFAYCHDSVSCKKWASSHPFPIAREEAEHVGEVYDQFEVGRAGDLAIIRRTPVNQNCVENKYDLQNTDPLWL